MAKTQIRSGDLEDLGVATVDLADDAVTVDKLAHNIDATVIGFDADTVDGQHASALGGMPRSHLAGLELSNGTDGNHDIDIAVGECLDSTNAQSMTLSSSLTKQLDAPWAVGSAVGGLGTGELASGINLTFNDNGASPDDVTAASGTPFVNSAVGDTIVITDSVSNNGTYQITGVTSDTVITVATGSFTQEGPVAAKIYTIESDQTYHVFLIRKTDGTIDAGFDTSLTASNLLTESAYSQYRDIGSVLTSAAANILGFTQDGDFFQLNDPPLDIDDTNPGTSAVLRLLSVPLGKRVVAIYNLVFYRSAGGSDCYMSSPDVNDEQASFTTAPLQVGRSGAQQSAGQVETMTDTNGQIRSRITPSDSGLVFRIATLGWKDRRGRDG